MPLSHRQGLGHSRCGDTKASCNRAADRQANAGRRAPQGAGRQVRSRPEGTNAWGSLDWEPADTPDLDVRTHSGTVVAGSFQNLHPNLDSTHQTPALRHGIRASQLPGE